MTYSYEFRFRIKEETFGEWESKLVRIENGTNYEKVLVLLTSTLIEDLKIIVGKENVKSEIERFMDDEKIPKNTQNQFLDRIYI